MTGLGAPYWDQYAKGTICGLTRGTTAAHIARAALEGIAFETMDIVNAMQKDSGIRLKELKVDGGASRNNLMMQFQADILGCIRKQWKADKEFEPLAPAEKVLLAKEGWADAIRRTLSGKGQ